MKNYQITLTPLEPYFFGGARTFGKKGDKKHGSYIAQSTKLPQQTAFLGLLRKEILSYHNALNKENENFDELKALVGTNRFKINTKHKYKKNDYGALVSISEVLIQEKEQTYYILKDIFDFKLSQDPFILQGYTPKKSIEHKLFSSDFQKSISLDDILTPKEQVGNAKGDDTNGFFKKISYTMKQGYSFSYFIEWDHDFDLKKLSQKIVFFGAERSKFLLEVKTAPKPTLTGVKKLKDDEEHMLLLSDSYIDVTLAKECAFALSSETSFSYLTNHQKGSIKSKVYFLYEKGTLIINPSEKLKQNIEKQSLQQVGYNNYIIY
jgi:hypothetical protein